MADENTPSATKPKKEKVNLTEDEIDVLVSLWSKEEVLFNCKHADYHKKDARNAATLRILKNLNKEGLSQEELVKKMGSLRTYFGKEVGKERYSKTSGSGRKEAYTSKWPFFKSLQFLKDNITPRKTASNIEPIVIEADEQSDLSLHNDLDINSQSENTPPVVDNCIFKLSNPPSTKSKKKKAAELEEELLSTCLQELKKPRGSSVPEDADTAFGNYVANQLKNIPDGYAKEMMKIEIQQLIVKTMMKCTSRQPAEHLTTIDFSQF